MRGGKYATPLDDTQLPQIMVLVSVSSGCYNKIPDWVAGAAGILSHSLEAAGQRSA